MWGISQASYEEEGSPPDFCGSLRSLLTSNLTALLLLPTEFQNTPKSLWKQSNPNPSLHWSNRRPAQFVQQTLPAQGLALGPAPTISHIPALKSHRLALGRGWSELGDSQNET